MADPVDRQPSLHLMVAGALARAGWTPTQIAEHLNIPPAFATLLHQTAVRDGELQPGIDSKLLGALAETVKPTANSAASPLIISSEHPSAAVVVRPTRRIRFTTYIAGVVALTTALAVSSLARIPVAAHLAGAFVAGGCLLAIHEYARRRVIPRPRRQRTDCRRQPRPPSQR